MASTKTPTSPTTVEQWLNDLALANPARLELVQAARKVIYMQAPEASERVMYGGLMFSAPAQFCGVFAYSEHVSVEFGRGCDLADPHGVLEGSGKFRRHIKLRSLADIKARHLADTVRQAVEISRTS
jgi:hypothetical protein